MSIQSFDGPPPGSEARSLAPQRASTTYGPAGEAGGAIGKIGAEAASYFLPTFVATTETL